MTEWTGGGKGENGGTEFCCQNVKLILCLSNEHKLHSFRPKYWIVFIQNPRHDYVV